MLETDVYEPLAPDESPLPAFVFLSAMNGDAWGGSEAWWFTVAQELARQGQDVTCAYFDWPDHKQGIQRTLEEAGCRVKKLPNPKQAKGFIDRFFLRNQGRVNVTRLVTEQPCLVVISQGGYEDVTHSPFHNLLPFLQKFILVSHNYDESHQLSASRRKQLEKWYERSMLNWMASARIPDAIQKIAGFLPSRTEVLINPISIPVMDNVCPLPTTGEQQPAIFVMLSQLDCTRKAQDLLIPSFDTPAWKSRHWELHIYGEGYDHAYLEQLIRLHGLEKHIFLRGRTTHVADVLRNAHLLLQITRIDAMPLSVCEAMNMGRPCMVSAVGDMPNWITQDQQGWVVPELTIASIQQTLERAWLQQEHWSQYGEAAFYRFRERYPIPYAATYAKRLIELAGTSAR